MLSRAEPKSAIAAAALSCLFIIGAVGGFLLGIESLPSGKAAVVALNVGMAGAVLILLIRTVRKRRGKIRN